MRSRAGLQAGQGSRGPASEASLRRISLNDLGDLCQTTLAHAHQLELVVGGLSMHPTIQDGETVRIVRSRSGVRLGRIVLYRPLGGGLVAHRIVAWIPAWGGRPASLLAGGDSRCGKIERVNRSDILGEIVAVRRGSLWFRIDRLAFRFLFLTRFWARMLLRLAARRLNALRGRTKPAAEKSGGPPSKQVSP